MTLLFTVLSMITLSAIGVFLAKKDSVAGGFVKALSTAGLAIVGAAAGVHPIITIGLALAVLGDVVLSFLKPLLKKDFLFFVGLGVFAFAYAAMAIGLCHLGNFSYFGMGVTIAIVVIGDFQLLYLDKADKLTKGIFVFYLTIISALVAASAFVGPLPLLAAALLYFSDSIIGHSNYNSKYKLSSTVTDLLITVTFAAGLALLSTSTL